MLLVMEFVSNGCLRSYLNNNKKTSVNELLRFSFEIVQVLPSTCLLTTTNSTAPYLLTYNTT